MNITRKICLIISEIVLTVCYLFSVLVLSGSIFDRSGPGDEMIMTAALFVLSVTGLVMARHEGRTVMILIMLHFLLHTIFMSILTAALIISEHITEWALYSILLIQPVVLLVLSVVFLIRWRRYAGSGPVSPVPFIVYSAAFVSAAVVMWRILESIPNHLDDAILHLLIIAVAFMALLSIVILSVYVSGGAHPDTTEEKGADDV